MKDSWVSPPAELSLSDILRRALQEQTRKRLLANDWGRIYQTALAEARRLAA